MYNPENFLNLSLALNLKAVNGIFSISMISGGGSLSDLIFQNLSKGDYSSYDDLLEMKVVKHFNNKIHFRPVCILTSLHELKKDHHEHI